MTRIALPPLGELRRVHPLAEIPPELRTRDLARYAHHEAGHVVLLEWVGIAPESARADDCGGEVRFDPGQLDQDTGPNDYDRPLAATQAAACFHAGILAELIHTGHPWKGVTIRHRPGDWQKARTILTPHFGNGLAGHGFSQRVALAVLTARWPRVQEVAGQLIERGTWSPEHGGALARSRQDRPGNLCRPMVGVRTSSRSSTPLSKLAE
jgi:hypothetical protein